MSVRIVTDSGCDLAPEVAEALGIAVVPLSIRFGSTEYTDRVDLSPEQFYAEMDSRDELPETAAPAPGAFAEAFDQLAREGATSIVCINLSEALSATAQAARTAAGTVDGIDIHIVDSKSATVGQGTLVLRAAEAARDGAEAGEIIAQTNDLSARTHVLGILDTLDNLKKGGRIGNAKALLATALAIKPIIEVQDGTVEQSGKQRTRSKALKFLVERVVEYEGRISDLAVLHADCSDVEQFVDMLRPHYDGDIVIGEIGPVIGTHAGRGTIGVAFDVID